MSSFKLSRDVLLGLALLGLIVLVYLRFPAFASARSLLDVFNDTSILIILALGQMAVILTRCIDLSMASNLALVGMCTAMLNAAAPGIPIPLLVAVAMMLGAFLGSINGILVWKLDIPPIVVTLGTLTIFRGMIFLISDGQWVNAHEMSPAFKALPRLHFLGVASLSWAALLCIVFMYVLLIRTPAGRAFYAVGGNPDAAVYTGIDVGRTRFNAFVLSGALSGIAGYFWVSRYAVAYVDIAAGFELDVVAACVIGGISIAGGIGSVAGAVLGALFLGVIKNALPVINISPFWQQAIFWFRHYCCRDIQCAFGKACGPHHPETGRAYMSNSGEFDSASNPVIPDRLRSPLVRLLSSWEFLLLGVAIVIFLFKYTGVTLLP